MLLHLDAQIADQPTTTREESSAISKRILGLIAKQNQHIAIEAVRQQSAIVLRKDLPFL
jgi:hypothetical protein